MEVINTMILTGILFGAISIFIAYKNSIKWVKKFTKKTYAKIVDVKTTSKVKNFFDNDNRIREVIVYIHDVKYEYVVNNEIFVGSATFEKKISPKIGRKLCIYYNEITPRNSMSAKQRNALRNNMLLFLTIMFSIWFLMLYYNMIVSR